jgi:hypothetical protein
MFNVQTGFKKAINALYRRVRRLFVPDASELIHHLTEVYYDKGVASGIREITLLRHPLAFRYGEADQAVFPPWFRQEHAFPERYLFRVRAAEVISPCGGVRFCGKWVQESFGHYGEVLWAVARFRIERLCRFWRRSRAAYPDGLYTCLRGMGYYHFLLCALPELLHVLRRYPEAKILLCSSGPYPFVDAYLGLLRGQDRVVIPPLTIADVSDFAFAAAEPHCGFVPPDDILMLRDTFLPMAAAESAGTGNPKIFLSRKKGTRSFTNQDEIERALVAMGFDIVCLEDLSVLQQIALFRAAEVIVANHGAGLANLIWGNRDAKVLELFAPTFLNDCYYRLAKTMGMAYQYVIADGAEWGAVDLAKVRARLTLFGVCAENA